MSEMLVSKRISAPRFLGAPLPEIQKRKPRDSAQLRERPAGKHKPHPNVSLRPYPTTISRAGSAFYQRGQIETFGPAPTIVMRVVAAAIPSRAVLPRSRGYCFFF